MSGIYNTRWYCIPLIGIIYVKFPYIYWFPWRINQIFWNTPLDMLRYSRYLRPEAMWNEKWSDWWRVCVCVCLCVCLCVTFSVEHSIEEVLGLSLQPADPRLLLFEVFTIRQHLAASTVLSAVLLQRRTHGRKCVSKSLYCQKIINPHTSIPLTNITSSCGCSDVLQPQTFPSF